MSSTMAAIASMLLHLSWQGVLIGLAAWFAFRLAGPRAASARYRIAIGALGLLALAPAGTLARRSGWLAESSTGWLTLVPGWPRQAGSPAEGVARPAPPALDQSTDTGTAPARRAALSWLLAAWLMGAGLGIIRLGAGIARLRLLRGGSFPAPPWIRRDAESLADRFGLARPVELRLTGRIDIPLTYGARRPIVLLPVRMLDGLDTEALRLVLAHELAHVARRDYAVNLAQCVAQALFFFHPVAHWLSRTARAEREHCCDELAALAAGSRHQVARALVALEELVAGRGARSLAPAATGGSLLCRVERLVSAAAPPRRSRTALSIGVLAVAPAPLILATPAGAPVAESDFQVVWSGEVGSGERLQVQNLVGSIRVVAAPGSRARIRARVTRGVLPDLVFTPAPDPRGLTVCALRAAHGRCNAEGYTWFGSEVEMHRAVIDLVVELPAGAGIAAAGYAGDLLLDGISGDAEARTGRGNITARVAPARDGRALQLHTGAGDVRVSLPRNFGGILQARLSSGTVEHEMPLSPLDGSTARRMLASLGPGTNRLDASSGRGSLLLLRSP